MIHYKFWYIKRDDDGFITEAAIRVYSGDFETVEEKNSITDEVRTVTKFKVVKRMSSSELKSKKSKMETNGNEVVLLHPDDFGRIKEDADLIDYCNKYKWQL